MSTSQRWRDRLKIHPAADLFPELSKEDLSALAEDIKQHGLRELVSLQGTDQDGHRVLVDGRGRLDALKLLGEDIFGGPRQIIQELPPDVDPVAYIMSKNIHRRHLTEGQKHALIGKL